MEFNVKAYEKYNLLQKQDSEQLLAHLKCLYGDRKLKTFVDIGCGPGNITTLVPDYLNCDRIIAFDADPKMINLANDAVDRPEVEFKVANICDNDLNSVLGISDLGADLAFSSYCMHWVHPNDRIKAMGNVWALLKPGGTCHFLLACIEPRTLNQVDLMVADPKWKKYMTSWRYPQDLNEEPIYITVQKEANQLTSNERVEIWRNVCLKLGFEDVQVNVKETCIDFKSMDNIIGFNLTFSPFYTTTIPEHLHEEFLIDFHKYMKFVYYHQRPKDPDSFVFSHCHIAISAKKPIL